MHDINHRSEPTEEPWLRTFLSGLPTPVLLIALAAVTWWFATLPKTMYGKVPQVSTDTAQQAKTAIDASKLNREVAQDLAATATQLKKSAATRRQAQKLLAGSGPPRCW